MPFFVARVSAHYGMDYYQVLRMPLRTFWSYNRQVDRLRAEAELRQLRLLNAAGEAESAKALAAQLEQTVAMPVLVEKQFDQARFDEVAALFNKKRVADDTHAEEGSE